MEVLRYLLVVVAGYLLGSLSASLLLSKVGWGKDVRKHGSGNAGATNMARVFGLGAGLATLGCDMLKAAAAIPGNRIQIAGRFEYADALVTGIGNI